MADNSIVCKSRGSALSGLETIAASMPRGTQRDVLVAIKDWIARNIRPPLDEATIARIKEIFEGDEWEQKGRAWLDHETSDPRERPQGIQII